MMMPVTAADSTGWSAAHQQLQHCPSYGRLVDIYCSCTQTNAALQLAQRAQSSQGAEWTAARPRIPAVPPLRSGQQPAAHGLFSAASISRPRGTDCGEVLPNAAHPLMHVDVRAQSPPVSSIGHRSCTSSSRRCMANMKLVNTYSRASRRVFTLHFPGGD